MLLEEWLSSWLALRSGGLAPRTVDCYTSTIRHHISPAIGSIELDQLRPADCMQCLAGICAGGHTRTAQLTHAVLHRALADAAANGLLTVSPMSSVSRPAHRPRRARWLSPDEITIYTAAVAADPYRAAWLLALCCGLRRGELCGLRWSDVDFAASVIHIRNQRQRLDSGQIIDCPPKSQAGERDIPMPLPVAAALRPIRHVGGYVVRSTRTHKPLTPSGLDQAHHRLLDRAGLPPVRLHDIRHTMGAVAIRQQVPLKVLQYILGHAHYATTADIYAHVDESIIRESIAQISAAMV